MVEWTDSHEMRLNSDKTRYMIINFCHSLQFRTRLHIDTSLLEQVQETRLLGVILRDDLTWHSNTKHLVTRAYQRMIILRNLYEFNVPIEDMLKIYILFIRSVVEQSCVVWSSSITTEEVNCLEHTHKCALSIIYRENYISYSNALRLSKLLTLSQHRSELSYTFALRCTKNEKTKDMFPLNNVTTNTRKSEKNLVPFASTSRLANLAIHTMARQLNARHEA